MLQIDNMILNTTVEQIIKDLRDELNLKYGFIYFKDIKAVNDDLMVTCPFHKNGQERKPSAGINVNTGLFHCFTCGESMSLTVLISRLFEHFDRGKYGTQWLRDRYLDSEYIKRPGIPMPQRKQPIKIDYISEDELDTYRWEHPYMWKRKLTPEIVEQFDIGYDKETNCITFPVNDITGKCVFVARRSVQGKFFNYPAGSEKPIYALDKCINDKSIIIVESFINALTLWTYGLHAIAFIGTGSSYQYDILKKCSFRQYILCFDGDDAGRNAAKRFVKNFPNVNISIITVPEGEDVNSITKEQFFDCYEKRRKVQ